MPDGRAALHCERLGSKDELLVCGLYMLRSYHCHERKETYKFGEAVCEFATFVSENWGGDRRCGGFRHPLTNYAHIVIALRAPSVVQQQPPPKVLS